MQFYVRHKKLVKVSATIALTFGVGWAIKEIKKTYNILNNVLDTSVINFLEPVKYPDLDEDPEDNYAISNWIDMPDEPNQSIWKSLKFIYSREILKFANNNNSLIKSKAIKQLTTITDLDNWHYSYLAQLLNAKTAVKIARIKNVDNRYFPKPPLRYLSYNHEMLVKSMKNLLISLNSESPHACMEYFINKAFDQDAAHNFIDNESTLSELRKLIIAATDILPLCLESLLHHAALSNNARDIVNLDGLTLLMEIYNRFNDSLDIKVKLCNILSYISVYPELLEDIYRSGWISVLAEWINEEDVRLSSIAAKILANLDDNNYNALYHKEVYVLHPLHQLEKPANVDVIFVHGLLGGVFFTWRQRRRITFTGFFSNTIFKKTVTDVQGKLLRTSDPIMREYIQDAEVRNQDEWNLVGQDFEFVLNDIPLSTNTEASGPYTCSGTHDCVSQAMQDCCSHTMCWPRDWLSQDCKNLRILGINYDTSLSAWAKICPNEQKKSTIEERSDEFLDSLMKAGVGDRPIIWITHSMGGLIVKNLLWKAWESKSEKEKNICLNTKGIVFYSTPHIGSPAANLSSPTALLLWPSVEIQELRLDSPALFRIHENFLKLAEEIPIKVLSFVETKSTLVTALKFNLLFVDSRSGNPSIGEYFEIPQDHLGICKPASRMSFLYQKVLHLIQEIADEAK